MFCRLKQTEHDSNELFNLPDALGKKVQVCDATKLIVDTDAWSIKPIFLYPLFSWLGSYCTKIMDLLLIIWYNLMVRA
jgi:hypothetical protein